MKQSFIIALIAACGIAVAQAQTGGSSGAGTSGSTSGQQNPATSGSTYQGSSSSQGSSSQSGSLSATGRSSSQQQQNVQASKLMGANVTSSQGQTIGTIQDCIINSQSGKIDFAIIELQSGGSQSGSSSQGGSTGAGTGSSTTGAGTSAGSGAATGTSGSSSSSASRLLGGSDRQVAVPWALLKPATASTSATSSSQQGQQSFTFSGEQSKLQNAPRFDENNFQSMGMQWRQSVYSHFGVQPGTSTGGSESPGGVGTGSSSSQGGSSLDPSTGSSGSSTGGSSSSGSGSSSGSQQPSTPPSTR